MFRKVEHPVLGRQVPASEWQEPDRERQVQTQPVKFTCDGKRYVQTQPAVQGCDGEVLSKVRKFMTKTEKERLSGLRKPETSSSSRYWQMLRGRSQPIREVDVPEPILEDVVWGGSNSKTRPNPVSHLRKPSTSPELRFVFTNATRYPSTHVRGGYDSRLPTCNISSPFSSLQRPQVLLHSGPIEMSGAIQSIPSDSQRPPLNTPFVIPAQKQNLETTSGNIVPKSKIPSSDSTAESLMRGYMSSRDSADDLESRVQYYLNSLNSAGDQRPLISPSDQSNPILGSNLRSDNQKQESTTTNSNTVPEAEYPCSDFTAESRIREYLNSVNSADSQGPLISLGDQIDLIFGSNPYSEFDKWKPTTRNGSIVPEVENPGAENSCSNPTEESLNQEDFIGLNSADDQRPAISLSIQIHQIFASNPHDGTVERALKSIEQQKTEVPAQAKFDPKDNSQQAVQNKDKKKRCCKSDGKTKECFKERVNRRLSRVCEKIKRKRKPEITVTEEKDDSGDENRQNRFQRRSRRFSLD